MNCGNEFITGHKQSRLRNIPLRTLVQMFCTAGILLLAGCASGRISSHQTDIDNLRRDIQFLKQGNAQYQRQLEDLKKQLSELAETNRREKADYAARVDEVLAQMDAIQNQLLDANYRMTEFVERTRAPAGTPRPASPGMAEDSTAQPPQQSFAVDQSRELYNTAYRDLIRGNYQLALHGFQQFVSQYPNSDLADNAQYWIGEVYYAQGRYPNAIDEFEKVVKWYRDGDKTPSALLKIGYAYLNINETDQGKIYLEEVIQDYPDSDEANLAQGRLTSLNSN